ncbi:alkaline phosphatase-like protein [Gonapodya prolifera JEL478]|uniref:Alkaline phosphatase n=1 Tax=Gonapodya prolifera (strain JEL478) TaxID=1344416 RepID=A0A139ATV9_GONPJ|nr:alkaline phosphatase-like protein [Gonapodya prolifera JEL478]|eukprot:KXS20134.1 alkaline phosphatase-like protein [Gonapodya prolifera JEL478]
MSDPLSPGDEEAPLVTHADMDSIDAALQEQRRRRTRTAFGIVASILIGLSLTVAIVGGARRLLLDASAPQKRSVILIIPDGFGPASESMAREFYETIHPGTPPGFALPMDKILVGTARTRSNSSLVTDSAAGATAYACGKKSYNGAIGVDPSGTPCGTVLEAAKEAGLLTGLVATSRITHATPASFNAHVLHRDSENLIAEHQVGLGNLGVTTDLMFGGGRCHFLPSNDSESCRLDDKNLMLTAMEHGYDVITTRAEFDAKEYKLPVLGVFTPDHMSYTIDRDPAKEPSLAEMASRAIDMLHKATKSSDKGFFLMVECSRIDMAGHSNDPAAHVWDILACQDVVTEVKAYVDLDPGAVMVIVADHETGGMTIGRQTSPEYPIYQWMPDVLAKVHNGTERLAYYLVTLPSKIPDAKARRKHIVETVIPAWMGITDPTDAEVACLLNSTDFTQYYVAQQCLAEMTSVRALVGWTTHGHTGVDVNLYAHGLQSGKLRGNHENIEVSAFIQEFLGLSLDPISEKLKDSITTPVFVRSGTPRFTELHYHKQF